MRKAAPYLAVACALITLATAFNPFGTVQFTDLPMLSLALTALVLVALIPAEKTVQALVAWRVAWAGLAWYAWAKICAALAPMPLTAFFGLPGSGYGWLAIGALGVAVLLGAARSNRLRTALGTVAPFVLVGEGILVFWQLAGGHYPGGSFSNSSYLGLVVLALLPFSAETASDAAAPGWRRALGAVGVVVALAAMLVGDARVALVVGVAVTAAFAVRAVGSSRRWSVARTAGAWAASVAGLGAVLGVALVATGQTAVVGAFFADRSRLWGPALRAIGHRPITGFGPDGYDAGIYSFVSARGINPAAGFGQVSPDPHNLLLWVMVSTGIVGLALFGWWLYEIGRNWIHQVRAGGAASLFAPAVGALAYGALALTTPAAMQSMPIFALVLASSLRIEGSGVAVARGASAAKGAAPQASRLQGLAARTARWLAIVLVAISLLGTLTRLSIARVDAQDQGDPRLTQALANAWHYDAFLYYRASIDWGYAVGRDSALRQTRPDLIAIRRAVALEPINPIYRTELARTLGFYGEPPSVVEPAFRDALRLFPGSPDAHAGYAEYLMSQGRMQDAGRVLEAGLAKSQAVELLDLAVTYYTQTGDTAKAQSYADKASAARDEARRMGYK
jgi:O-antigen ligase